MQKSSHKETEIPANPPNEIMSIIAINDLTQNITAKLWKLLCSLKVNSKYIILDIQSIQGPIKAKKASALDIPL